MKRKVLMFLMIVVAILTMTSCSDFFDYLDSGSASSNKGHSLEYVFYDSEKEEFKVKRDLVEQALDNKNSYEDFYDQFVEVDNHIMDIATYANIEYVNYAMSGNEDNLDKYSEFSLYLNELIEWEEGVLREVYNSNYKEKFFAGLTEEQILEYIGPEYSSSFYELEAEAEEIIGEYTLMDEEEMLANVKGLYVDLVDTYNRMANAAGYDNYLEYSYENIYGRDYTPEDSIQIAEYVKEYIVPLFFDVYERYENAFNTINSRDYNKVARFIEGNYTVNKNIFNSYAKMIGGSYYTNYNGLWDNGYFYFSNKETAINGAFTTYLYNLDTPAVYFGPDYQNIMTVVHEFGHYYAMKCQNGGGNSMDLNETHSQGNEMLFLAYVEQESDYVSSVTNVIKDYSFMNALSTMIYSVVVNEFERRVYEADSISTAQLDALFIEIFNEFGGYENYKDLFSIDPVDYWKYVAIENAGYYISYAVSLVPSLNLYQVANEDLDNAVDIYLELCNYTYLNDDFTTVITDAGLVNPFTEEAFQNIVSII